MYQISEERLAELQALVDAGKIPSVEFAVEAALANFCEVLNPARLTPEEIAEIERRTALADQGIGMLKYASAKELMDDVWARFFERREQTV